LFGWTQQISHVSDAAKTEKQRRYPSDRSNPPSRFTRGKRVAEHADQRDSADNKTNASEKERSRSADGFPSNEGSHSEN